ncbi:hypothetical protein Q8F55_006265 [Vanrija albida]|uniref:F-box domain-containing protein n=1 Tax=Vanrija albida TaxID=181172 RepID=A0ABR3PWN7_9TREE
MSLLDLQSFPHLADAIAASADRDTLLALRPVSRDFRDLADARLLAHIALRPVTPAQWVALGGSPDPQRSGLPISSFLAVVSLSYPGPLYPPKLYANWLDGAPDVPLLSIATREVGALLYERLTVRDAPASAQEESERAAWAARLRHVKVLDVDERMGYRCIQWWVDTLRAHGVELDAVRVSCETGIPPDSPVFMMARTVPTLPTQTVVAVPTQQGRGLRTPAAGFDTIIQWLPFSADEDPAVPYAVLDVEGLYPAAFDWHLKAQKSGYEMPSTRHAVFIMTLLHPEPCDFPEGCCEIDSGGTAWADVVTTVARMLFYGARCTLVDLDLVAPAWFRDYDSEDDTRPAADRLREHVVGALMHGDLGLELDVDENMGETAATELLDELLECLAGWEYAETLSPALRHAVWDGMLEDVPTRPEA